MPTEKPILFSGEMVRAILDGRKTQTRRVIKPQPRFDRMGLTDASFVNTYDETWAYPNVCPEKYYKCPYGKPGDLLWVRETWRESESHTWAGCQNLDAIHYKADHDEPDADGCWRPSIHMPRWASRITLEVTNVRVERLQDILVEDSLKEGMDHNPMNCPRMEFAQLWNSINEKRGYGWETNPWVWVVEFEREYAF